MNDQELSSISVDRNFTWSLRDIVAVGFRHQRALLLCFFGILLGSLVVAVLMPSTYEAKTKILVKRERVDPVVSTEAKSPVMIQETVTEEELNSEVELLQSEDVLRKVVVTSGLDQQKSLSEYILGRRSPETRIAKATRRLLSNLQVEAIKKSNIISVRYASTDPQLAARVLNTLDSAYIEKHIALHRPAGQLQFFENESEQYRNHLAAAEEKLKQFAAEQGGVAPQMARDLALQKLTEFKAALHQTQAEMAATKERMRNLEKQTGNTPDRLTTQMRETDDGQLLQQLKSTLMNLELKRTELLTKYQPSYRLVQEVDKQIADTRTAIEEDQKRPLREQTTDQNPTYAWINGELAKAKAEYSGLDARAIATQAVVNQYETMTRQLEQKGILQQDLTRTAKADEENYLLYQRKREEARIAEALDRTKIMNVAIAESPVVPSLAASSPWLFALLGVFLATAATLGLAFALEYSDSSFRTPREVLSELNIPLLAAVPMEANVESSNGNGSHNGNYNRDRAGQHKNIASDELTGKA